MRRLLFRLRRKRPRLRVRPSVPSLHELPKDAPALIVVNIGREAAFNVIVSIRVRASAFQFDEIPQLEPKAEAPLLHQSGGGRIQFDTTSTSTNWLRILLRTVVRDTGMDLRIPLVVRYKDGGIERTQHQTLHCDEDLRLRVTNG